MSKTRFRIFAGLAVAAGVAAAAIVAPWLQARFRQPPGMQALWAVHFQSLGQMVRNSDAIVLATVQATRPGRQVSTSGGRNTLAFTLVDLRVDQPIKGSAGTSLTVEQTGGLVGERTLYVDGDGGEYDNDERVLLFLNRQPGTNYYYVANPQGRFSVEGGRLRAVVATDPVAQQLHGKTPAEAVGLIRSAP